MMKINKKSFFMMMTINLKGWREMCKVSQNQGGPVYIFKYDSCKFR